MNLYIVRHGQTDANVKGVFQGRIDVRLNKEGKRQVLELAHKFNNIKVDYILCSPLMRAKQTASVISKLNKIPVKIDNSLIERSFGDMEGKSPTEEFNINLLTDFDINYDKYNVETIKDLFTRVYQRIEKIKIEYLNKDIIIVTHAGVAQAIISYFDGSKKDVLEYTLQNAEVKKIHID